MSQNEEPSFPNPLDEHGNPVWAHGYGGMTIKDYFAAQCCGHLAEAFIMHGSEYTAEIVALMA